MKRTTERTTKRATVCSKIVIGAALASALVPGAAFAATGGYETAVAGAPLMSAGARGGGEDAGGSSPLLAQMQGELSDLIAQAQAAQAERTDKVLPYDPADIAAIGTQEATGHSICCPSFSCAYADAVMDGTVHDHGYYTCSCCSWTDWGGGDSSFRCVGTDEQLLREAYDQIAAGKPTVVHVAAGYGEHWIALIGYEGAADPDHLTLSNFIALDPWDGAQVNAAERFSLYGDGCEHVSER